MKEIPQLTVEPGIDPNRIVLNEHRLSTVHRWTGMDSIEEHHPKIKLALGVLFVAGLACSSGIGEGIPVNMHVTQAFGVKPTGSLTLVEPVSTLPWTPQNPIPTPNLTENQSLPPTPAIPPFAVPTLPGVEPTPIRLGEMFLTAISREGFPYRLVTNRTPQGMVTVGMSAATPGCVAYSVETAGSEPVEFGSLCTGKIITTSVPDPIIRFGLFIPEGQSQGFNCYTVIGPPSILPGITMLKEEGVIISDNVCWEDSLFSQPRNPEPGESF